MTELEIILNMIGAAATRLKKRVDLIYIGGKKRRGEVIEPLFCGLHEQCVHFRSATDSYGTQSQEEPPRGVPV